MIRAFRYTPIHGVLIGGGAAGLLDIAYAMIAAAQRGRSPVRAVQAVASGLLGAPAFEGGARTFALGLALHFFIACVAAGVYYLASRKASVLRSKVVVPGTVFGVLVYLFMNFVVLPLSAVPFKLSYPLPVLIAGFLSHVLFVGLPIAVAVRRVWSTAEPGA